MALKERYMVSLGGSGGKKKKDGSADVGTAAVAAQGITGTGKGNGKSGIAYNPASIVDYLKMNGQDSSYAARKKLAQKNGITGYSGTAAQNTELLRLLKGGASPAAGMDVGIKRAEEKIGEPKNAKQPAVGGQTQNVDLADVILQKVTGNVTGQKKDAGDMSSPQATTPAAGNSTPVTAFRPVSGTPEFQVSEAYTKAMDYTNTLLQQLSSGKTSYTDQIGKLLQEYKEREAFSYDPANDAMFQQMLAQSANSGKTAMQDAMGQAAALTGGYGSTYSTAVGNNVYAQYLQDAYAQMPDYYRLALDAYGQEGQQMLNELGILTDADAKEYDRLLNAYGANLQNAQNMYSQEYGAWQDALSQANYENQFAYQQYLDELSQGNYEREFAYRQEQDRLSQKNYEDQFAYGQAQDALSQKNYEEQFDYQKYLDRLSQGNYEREFAYKKSQDAQSQKNYEEELAYKKYLDGLSQANYEREFAYQQAQDAQSQKNYEEELAYKKYLDGLGASQEASGKGLAEASDSVKRKALEEYEKYGDEGLMRFVASVDGSKYNQEGIYEYALSYGKTPVGQEEFTKTKDTINWFWGIDHNDLVEFGGKEMKISQVQDQLTEYYISIGDSKSEAKRKAKEAAKRLTGLKKGEKLKLSE